jgi:tetratricopeptide (TPR) repeat protein
LTPVQRLNREGVKAIDKHDYESAGTLFYKAYLYDPADPFTLNNLGFVAELQGNLDRARNFYDLALKQSSTAAIDRSSARGLEGKPMRAALDGIDDLPMRVNRINLDSMRLLREHHGLEAAGLLKGALALDPANPFTLNNLGVAHESIGDYDIQRRLRDMSPQETQSIMFTMRGVTAANQNDWASARENFLKAYSLNPRSAFSLNNRGYIAEKEGDLETAQFFYEKARRAEDARARVGLATQSFAEGQDLLTVAADSNQKVDDALEQYSRQRRRETGPVELTPRGAGQEQEKPPAPNSPPAESPSQPH